MATTPKVQIIVPKAMQIVVVTTINLPIVVITPTTPTETIVTIEIRTTLQIIITTIETLPTVLQITRFQQKLVLFMVVINGKIVFLIPMVITIVPGQLKATIATATIEVTVIILIPPAIIILIITITIMVLGTTIVTIPHHVVISIILSLFLTVVLRWNGMITSSSLQKLNWIQPNYLILSLSPPNQHSLLCRARMMKAMI
jgi:hypothetical protein